MGKSKEKENKDTIVGEIVKVDFAMQEAMEDAGMEAKTYGIWGLFWDFRSELRKH